MWTTEIDVETFGFESQDTTNLKKYIGTRKVTN